MVTVITRTIGPSGRDYASFTLAEADVENIGTSADLVANDEAIVFEADAGTYSGSVTFSSTLTTDATRNVTYRAAAGSEHGGDKTAGVVLTSSSSTLTVVDAYTNVRGIVVSTTSTYGFTIKADGAVASDCIAVGANPSIPSYGFYCNSGGTASAPIRIENCVAYSATAGALYAYSVAADINIVIVNTTGIVTGGSLDCFRFFEGGFQATVTLTNCLAINLGSGGACQTHTATFSGTNNFGPATAPFPVALRGTPYPITPTTSFSTPLGSGDYAVYMGATGALANVTGNDVWQQGVGPLVNSDVPTTDINGVARSGATCNPGAFEADGVVAPTVLTRTIGSGKDYASFTLAEADVSNIGGSADLTFENEAIVFEADAATYSESVTFSSTLTTDATRNVTYKPAAGSEHGGDSSAGVIIQSAAFATLIVQDNYIVLDGLHTKGGYAVYNPAGAGGTVYRNLICTSTGNYGIECAPTTSIPVAPITIENCVISGAAAYNLDLRPTTIAGTTVYDVRNCTLIGTKGFRVGVTGVAGSVVEIDALNNLALLGDVWVESGSGTVTVTGSNNFGGSSLPFPVAIQGSPATITASTAYDPGAGDFALYVGKNGALLDSPNNDVIGGGVGPSVNSDVPTTDILGNPRSGATANPGAFEVPQATATLTRTIGPVGRDYASFTLAEADVTNIGGSADLVNENERIVFEADAATYNEPSQIYVNSTLVTDATRHVTYKAAPGSEHGGILGAGVLIDQLTGSRGFYITDAHTHLIGLGVRAILDGCMALNQGTVAQNCIFESTTSHGLIGISNAGIVAENCVAFHQGNRYGFYLYINPGFTADAKYRNCTAINRAPSNGFSFNMSSAGGDLTAEIVNCLGISDSTYNQAAFSGGTAAVTGSNNFGGSLNPFPAALQGSPYPITATTNTSPGPGDWAIYEAATGRLYHVPDNDVWDQGVGPASNSDVPTTDILGAARSGSTANPGAFETGVPPTVTTNQLVAPNGRLEADTISHIDQYTYVTLEKSGALSGGETVSYHWYFKVDSTLAAGAGETVTFSMKDTGGVVIEEINWAVAYDDATPTVALGSTTTAGSGYTVSALAYAAVSNDWVRCSITLTDHSSRGRDVVVTHTSMMGAASAGTIYGVTIWGSEVTTLDRTPTANELRPVSGGIVDFDAYPAEHRSLFGSYTDLGDNQYRVGITLTDDTSSADYARIEHYQANSAETTHQIYLNSPSVDDIDLDLLQDVLISPPKPGAPFFDIPLITHAVHELGNDGRVPTTVATFGYYAGHLGWWDTEGAVVEKEPQPYGGDKITVIVPPVRGNGSTP